MSSPRTPLRAATGFALPSTVPDEVGIPAEALKRLCERLVERGLIMHSLLVVRRGCLVFEQYGMPYTATSPHRLYSVSKSLVSLAIGTLVDDGLLDLDARVIDMLGEDIDGVEAHPWIAEARVHDLLTMSGPHASTTYKRTDDTDWVRTYFTLQPDRQPGTAFAYDTSGTVVLTRIVERLAGRRVAEHLRERILDPIGCDGSFTSLMTPKGLDPIARRGAPAWREVERNDAGVSHGGSGFSCTPRDLARIALLCLREGIVPGADGVERRILSAEYLRAATGYRVSTLTNPDHHPDGRQGYGYQFWRTRHGGFAALGMGGQVALCLPETDLIVVATGDNQPDGLGIHAILDAVWSELLPAIDDIVPDLGAASTSFAPRAPAGVLPAPCVTAQWTFAEGATDLAALRVSTDPARGALTLIDRSGAVREIPFGIGEFVAHPLPGYGYPSRSAGAWVDETTLHVRTHVTGDFLAQIEFTLGLNGEAATLVMQRSAEFFADEYAGVASGRRSRLPGPTPHRNPPTLTMRIP